MEKITGRQVGLRHKSAPRPPPLRTVLSTHRRLGVGAEGDLTSPHAGGAQLSEEDRSLSFGGL